jgi:hypothetical protein
VPAYHVIFIYAIAAQTARRQVKGISCLYKYLPATKAYNVNTEKAIGRFGSTKYRPQDSSPFLL